MNLIIHLVCCCAIVTTTGCTSDNNRDIVCTNGLRPIDSIDKHQEWLNRNDEYIDKLNNPPKYSAGLVPYPNMSNEYAAYLRGAESGWREGIQGYNDETTMDTSHETELPQFREGYARGVQEGKQYIARLKQLADEKF